MTSESDVEQKFVYPLLTVASPEGLGLSPASVKTKVSLRRLTIGKGSDQKLYIPDYVVLQNGWPVLVVEVKSPGEDLPQAYREARLYAAELNAQYPTGLNPVSRVIATNATQLFAGHHDQATPKIIASFDEIHSVSSKLAELFDLVGEDVLRMLGQGLSKVADPLSYRKPRRLLGGNAIQDGVVGYNSFGATISTDMAHIFNPVSRVDRANIAKNGYISSKRRERYIDPIDRVIRASTPMAQLEAQQIEDTEIPETLIKTFQSERQLEHQVLLIVGGAGVGKTTFVDHLQEVALPRDVRDRTIWVHINMNPAPVSKEEIYNFLRKQIIEKIQLSQPESDWADLTQLLSLYSVEVNKFRKRAGVLLGVGSALYNEKLFEVIDRADNDLHNKAVSLTRYCGTERGKLVIIVLDNSDKRNRDEQLLMFEAANWLQSEFRALVVLPLRDETYDNHRDEKPLDTAIKDLVFRIEPPQFQSVLVRRVQLALDELSKTSPKRYKYDLPNGFQVEYPASDQAFYLTSMIKSIFEHDRHIRRLILGLSGRNLRRAMELFLEFCKSGHIMESHILKIRHSEGAHILPLQLVVTVLLRGSRRFYDSNNSHLKNVVALDVDDHRPSYFIRLLVLRWLSDRFGSPGPTRLHGYFPIRDIINDLAVFGADQTIVEREVEFLSNAHCIVSEDLTEGSLSSDDLVKLAPAGFVHLDLMNNAHYWAAVAEDTWFDDQATAHRIAGRIGDAEQHYLPSTTLYNANECVQYLKRKAENEIRRHDALFQSSDLPGLLDLSTAEESIVRLEKEILPGAWSGVLTRYLSGMEFAAIIVNVQHYGVFAELEPGVSGLVHVSRLPKSFANDDRFGLGERIKVRIRSTDPVRHRIELEFIK